MNRRMWVIKRGKRYLRNYNEFTTISEYALLYRFKKHAKLARNHSEKIVPVMVTVKEVR